MRAHASHPGSAVVVLSHALVYAPMPTKAAWPKEVSPATPVSSTSPSATSAASAM